MRKEETRKDKRSRSRERLIRISVRKRNRIM